MNHCPLLMRHAMDLADELATPHLSTPAFLRLPQVELSADAAEQYLHQWAERGYLLVSIADDAETH